MVVFVAVTIQGQLGFANRLGIHCPLGLMILLGQPAMSLAVIRRRREPITAAGRSTVLAAVAGALGLAGCSPEASVAIADEPAHGQTPS